MPAAHRQTSNPEDIMSEWTYNDPAAAFERAIDECRLYDNSARPSPLWAGRFMYMGTDPSGRDQFKHRKTRLYLP